MRWRRETSGQAVLFVHSFSQSLALVDRANPSADATLAAYVGESVTLRYDPRDVAEIRVFHEQQFLCRAICPELAGATIPIREIVRARNKHRRDLQATVRDRRRTVDELMEIKRGDARINKEAEEKSPRIKDKKVTLKRYFNE